MKETNQTIEELDVVALLRDHPGEGLVIGQVGTVVEKLDAETVEVEFINANGECFSQLTLPVDELLVLHYSPVAA